VPEQSGLAHVGSGKVRELYDPGQGLLVLAASDRISAFDVVLPTPIAHKGRVLTALSDFWFARTASIVPNHLVSLRVDDIPGGPHDPDLRGRVMLVRRLAMFPVEFVVRGYLAGSGWRDYQATGAISGVSLPAGLRLADPLPEPVVTPAIKATSGHDENITAAQARDLCGDDYFDRAAAAALAVYAHGVEHARSRGIVLADTKFEFGLDEQGQVVLGDEVMTPDSSRFWPAGSVVPGASPPSFDKQYVRDWLEAQPWDKTDPGPELPADVANGVAERYQEAYRLLTDRPFSAYLEEQGVECA
jgi:phosphoribosylaminoimidazole-succinocarboxamide synthase